MRKQWLALCRHLPRYVFLPPQGSCDLHTAATPAAIAARALWVASMSSGRERADAPSRQG
jgi:hypothetical protein